MPRMLPFAALFTALPHILGAQADTALTYRRLEAAATIDGVSCARTGRASAGFFADGRLESCPLASDSTIAGHRLAAQTWIYLRNAALWRAWLIRDTPLDGVTCKGTGYKGWSVEFHPNGRLAMCYLAFEQTVQGVPCRAGSFFGEVTGGVKVYFHENGRLRTCQLAQEHTQGGVKYARRERIELDSAGAPVPRAPKQRTP